MPYKSKAQKLLMQAVLHNTKFVKKVGISQKVAKKFEMHEEIAASSAQNVPSVQDPTWMSKSAQLLYKKRNEKDGVGGPEGRKILGFKEFRDLKEMAFQQEIGTPKDQSKIMKAWYPIVNKHPEVSKISSNVSLHKYVMPGETMYNTLDHENRTMVHQATFTNESNPIQCVVQTGVRNYRHPDLPNHHAEKVAYEHFLQSDLPLRSDSSQSTSARNMWSRMAKRALDDGHHVYYSDEDGSLKELNSGNIDEHVNKYFGKDFRVHGKRHLILSKRSL